MTLPCWLRRAVRTRHRHAIEQASHRWRGGRRGESGRTRGKFDFHTGILYVAAGVGHFAAADAFRAITPPFGTWGLWPVPTAPAFHVAWTGQAELVGGATLVAGGAAALAGVELEAPVKFIPPAACAGLLLLTIAVTPANIYMYTHGATMGTPPLPLAFHYVRFAVQCVLLGLLATLAKDSFFYAWGDEIE